MRGLALVVLVGCSADGGKLDASGVYTGFVTVGQDGCGLKPTTPAIVSLTIAEGNTQTARITFTSSYADFLDGTLGMHTFDTTIEDPIAWHGVGTKLVATPSCSSLLIYGFDGSFDGAEFAGQLRFRTDPASTCTAVFGTDQELQLHRDPPDGW